MALTVGHLEMILYLCESFAPPVGSKRMKDFKTLKTYT